MALALYTMTQSFYFMHDFRHNDQCGSSMDSLYTTWSQLWKTVQHTLPQVAEDETKASHKE